MANESDKAMLSREEREQAGRRTNAGFARVERMEVAEGSTAIPTGTIGGELTEEEIRRRVGSGNFESAKNDLQSGSINS
ncbi:hypothetical protein [Paenibacillus sp. NFR01]|uniref:hypothetical protein n=1 Tax=Paenibacillus sp. NFR01 TaxID=1566279 RepID=UPI0008B8EDDB|nr:hypothetical protein [Paenibacillus sp. NFR01]SET05578.1 hypothetical protein SAMN03159358_0623 [Paenibacillus sp. NFR01]